MRISLDTMPSNNLTRSFPLPCFPRAIKRYVAATSVRHEIVEDPIALTRNQSVIVVDVDETYQPDSIGYADLYKGQSPNQRAPFSIECLDRGEIISERTLSILWYT